MSDTINGQNSLKVHLVCTTLWCIIGIFFFIVQTRQLIIQIKPLISQTNQFISQTNPFIGQTPKPSNSKQIHQYLPQPNTEIHSGMVSKRHQNNPFQKFSRSMTTNSYTKPYWENGKGYTN